METDHGDRPASAADESAAAPNESLILARSAMTRGDLRAALPHFEAASAADPKNLTILLRIARILNELERPGDAETVCRRILDEDPTHAKARWEISRAEWKQGRRSDALANLQAAIGDEPADPKSSLLLGQRLLGQSRSDEAEAAFGRVLAVEPDNVAALLGLGRCAIIRGDQEEAAGHFHAAAARDPGNQMIQSQIRRLNVNQAEYDWKSELMEAATVLRAGDSQRQQRAWAAKLLIAYGVTDLVQETLADAQTTSPELRRYLVAARQLDRMGLSQPSGALGQSADEDSEQLNALTGVVERLNPGAETLVLVFSGRLHRTFLSLDIMHRVLRTTGASLVYLRDLDRTRYLGGVVGMGAGFAETAEAFRAMMARSGARRLLTIGHCVGCAGALNFGLELGAEAVLGIAPRIAFPRADRLSPQAAAKLAALRIANPRFTRDLVSVYLDASTTPRVTLIGGADVEPDASFSREMSDKVPGVRFVAMPGAYSECFSEILARGLMSPLFCSFVAQGAAAPEVLDALSRDAPAESRPDLNPGPSKAGVAPQ